MKKVKILIVDDSAFAREVIINLLSSDSEIEIAGEAKNGMEAVEMVQNKSPDLVTMDINMPLLDGLEAIEQIMAFFPVPILVVTSRGDVDTAYKAISRGALEVIPKPEVAPDRPQEFVKKIKLLARVKVISHPLGKKNKRLGATSLPAINDTLTPLKKAVAIAASTGGPKALCRLLSQLPENFPSPIFIAQHIPQDFVNGMVEWLGEHSKLKVKEGENKEVIRAGTIYISPSQHHMSVSCFKKIQLNPTMPGDIYFPSCDTLLSSVADVYGKHSIGIVLTGMGDDGTKGIAKIKSAGGDTIAQDERSSVVFGMPDSAIKSGNIDMILSLDAICEEIIKLIQG